VMKTNAVSRKFNEDQSGNPNADGSGDSTQRFSLISKEWLSTTIKNMKINITAKGEFEDEKKDLVVFDDLWLKFSMMNIKDRRKKARLRRKQLFASEELETYIGYIKEEFQKEKETIINCGVHLCEILGGIDAKEYIHSRENNFANATLDIVQTFLPTPNIKAPEDLDKKTTSERINDVLNAAVEKFKEHKALVSVHRGGEAQRLFYCIVEDILNIVFGIDFEQFKVAVMNHHILEDELVRGQIEDFEREALEVLEGQYIE
jgi:hypothetical protein